MLTSALKMQARAMRPLARRFPLQLPTQMQTQVPLLQQITLQSTPCLPVHNEPQVGYMFSRGLKQVAIQRRKKRVRYMKRQREHAKRERHARTWRVVRGDRVFVYGKELADEFGGVGKEGVVARIDRLRELAYVTGVNEQQMSQTDPNTGEQATVTKLVPVQYDSLRLVDPKDGQATKTRMKFDENGYKSRVSVRTGEEIPWPEPKPVIHETHDRDTAPEDVLEVTYQGR